MTDNEAIEELKYDCNELGQPIPIDYEKYIDVIDNARFLRDAYWCPNCKHVVKSGSFL